MDGVNSADIQRQIAKNGAQHVDKLNKRALVLLNENLPVAEQAASDALTIAQHIAYHLGIATSHSLLGKIYTDQGHLDKGLSHLEAACVIFDELSDEYNKADTWNAIAVVHMKQGNYLHAVNYCQKAADIFEATEQWLDLSRVLNNMAVTYKLQGDFPMALLLYKRTLQLKRDFGDSLAIGRILNNLGNLYRERNLPDQALSYLEEAEELLRHSANQRNWALVLNNLAWCHLKLGKYGQAEQLLLQALSMHRKLDYHEGMTRALLLLSEIALTSKKWQQAIEHAVRAQALASHSGAKLEQRDAHQLLATAYAAIDNFQAAYENHQQYHNLDYEIFNYQNGLKLADIRNRHATELAQKETELYRLQTEELAIAKEAAEAANRAKSQFLAMMSHDLRTPLNAILGYANLLKNGHALERGPNIIEQSAHHLLALIDDLLDVAKIEAGKFDLQYQWISLPELLTDITDIVQLRVADRAVAFHAHIAPTLPPLLLADQRRLRQILTNLLDNALKFTQEGNVTLAVSIKEMVTLETESRGETHGHYRLHFAVSDTGIGIPSDQQETIFHAFEQIREQQQLSGGIGLGLTISKRLIELMGGELHLESTVGKGSTFSFTLSFPTAVDLTHKRSMPVVHGIRSPIPTILIVDDNQYNRAVLADFFASLGIPTLQAAHGEEAQAIIYEKKPQIALVDLVMPQQDGFTLIRHLRADKRLQDLVIVAVSAGTTGIEAAQSMQLGAQAFLQKPIAFHQLIATLEEVAGLEWVKEESIHHGGPTAAAVAEETTATYPTERLSILLHSIQQGDVDAIQSHIKQLDQSADHATRKLGNELATLFRSFQIQKLSQRISKILNESI